MHHGPLAAGRGDEEGLLERPWLLQVRPGCRCLSGVGGGGGGRGRRRRGGRHRKLGQGEQIQGKKVEKNSLPKSKDPFSELQREVPQ